MKDPTIPWGLYEDLNSAAYPLGWLPVVQNLLDTLTGSGLAKGHGNS